METKVVKKAISTEDRMKAVEAFLDERYSLRELGKKYGVHHSSVEKWVNAYLMFGEDGLCRRSTNKKYSEDLKKEAVELYLTTDHTLKEVCNKYKIRRISVLQKWILKYREDNEDRRI